MLKIDSLLISSLKKISVNDDDFLELDKLRIEYSELLLNRKEKFLTAIEFEKILCWKLDKQAHRSKLQRAVNVDSLVIPITKAYFSLSASDFSYETEVKIKLLSSLKGVGVPLASAVMSITEPEKYCIIDSVLWAYIFKEDKSAFTINDYLKFHHFIVKLSKKTDSDIQKTEFSLWKHSMYSKV
jgi:hypothetical protein